jgi:hypothetical protein
MYTFKAYLEENPVKITANRGDVAEVVLGAAVTARFWKHPYPEGTPVSEADVREILKKVIKTNPVKLNRDDYEVDTKINDVILKLSSSLKTQVIGNSSQNYFLVL